MRPLVKICGITNYDDAALALGLGADLLGFVLAPSPRRVAQESVREILLRLRGTGLLGDRPAVGVFVNEEAGRMADIMGSTGLSLAQVHGDEDPAACASFGFPWYRALRVSSPGDPARLAGAGGGAWSCGRLLFDAAVSGSYGGTGRGVSAEVAREAKKLCARGGREFFIAGGIGPDKVGALIGELSPDGIDVGSGVEEAPGRKSPAALRALFAAIAAAGEGA